MASPTEHQRALAVLTRLASDDLRDAWARVGVRSADTIRDFLLEVVPAIAERYGLPAGALAADWYDEVRAEAGVAGRFRAEPVTLPDRSRFEALVRWGVDPLYGVTPDAALAQSLVMGGLARIIGNVHRDTIGEATTKDPSRPRYARHASANACSFCALLATRGAVYWSEEAALRVSGANLGGKDYRKMRQFADQGAARDRILAGTRAKTIAQGGRKGRATKRPLGEKYHDHCHCVAVPVWGDYDEPPYVQAWRDAYAEAPAGDLKGTLASMRESLHTN